jgi:hypothetical protein
VTKTATLWFDPATPGILSTSAGALIGTLYVAAGVLCLSMKRWAATLAIGCLTVDILGEAFWHWKSRNKTGRPKIDRGLRDLIQRMNKENPQWGAARIHGELLMLGIEVAQSTVSKYMVRVGTPPSPGARIAVAKLEDSFSKPR